MQSPPGCDDQPMPLGVFLRKRAGILLLSLFSHSCRARCCNCKHNWKGNSSNIKLRGTAGAINRAPTIHAMNCGTTGAINRAPIDGDQSHSSTRLIPEELHFEAEKHLLSCLCILAAVTRYL